MNDNNIKETHPRGKSYYITCKQCGGSWWSHTPNPVECGLCRSKSWDNDEKQERGTAHTPLPSKIDHSDAKTLLAVGSRCPYCRGTTGYDTFKGVCFCFSCDSTWACTSGYFLGVIPGIGLRK